jgi:pectate lyase
MKLHVFSAVIPLLAQFVTAVPTPTTEQAEVVERAQIVKRAAITDIATTGFATQNGG